MDKELFIQRNSSTPKVTVSFVLFMIVDLSNTVGYRKTAMEAGMNGHLAKPYDVGEIMRTLKEILK